MVRLAIACLWLFLASPLFSASPRLYVQWSRINPQGFEQVTDWSALPNKPYMQGPLDGAPGWVAAVRIDGKVISACDHYAVVADAKQAHIISYCWLDGKGISFGVGLSVCTHEPLKCTEYTEAQIRSHLPPANLIRHGIYLKNWTEHKALW